MKAQIPPVGAETMARRLSACPASLKTLFERVYAKKCSPRQAIKAMCIECMGMDRGEVARCTSYACPLWHFRPFQNKKLT